MSDMILFDLDGTLTDSAPGILRCVQYALEQCVTPEPDTDKQRPFIGPPLHLIFPRYGAQSDEQNDRATDLFREYYARQGWAENIPYECMAEFLESLQKAGLKLVIATSKPEEFARRIMEHFDLASYFHRICGAQGENRASARKGGVVADALRRSGTDGPAVMVGDRRFDVAGAHENGLPAIGVLYGYGGREELENAGADYLAAALHALKQLLLQE